MKILYLISTFEKGVGGHYFSLQSTVEILSKEITPIVVNIGRRKSPIIERLDCKKYNLLYEYKNFFLIIQELLRIAKHHEINLIHCFDDRSYLFVRNSHFNSTPLILTKCGGSNPFFYPKADNLIVYSTENYNHFKNLKVAKNIFLIPNRIVPFSPNFSKVERLASHLDLKDTDLVFLRITRISNYYKKSLEQSIDLVRKLNLETPEVTIKLVIVGQIVDKDLFDLLQKSTDQNVFLITGEEYYSNAKEIIPICDFYVGTGRGLMEAASLKKILLTPAQNKKYPAPVTPENFESFFDTNFSERNQTDDDDEAILNKIKDIVFEKEKQENLKNFALDIFNSHFSIETKKEWYLNLYQNTREEGNKNFVDKVIHFLLFHYHYISQA